MHFRMGCYWKISSIVLQSGTGTVNENRQDAICCRQTGVSRLHVNISQQHVVKTHGEAKFKFISLRYVYVGCGRLTLGGEAKVNSTYS